MAAEEDLNAAIAHVVLSCVCSPCIGNTHIKNYTSPGLHANLFTHGILGFLNYQGTKFGDFSAIYKISLVASQTLPIACLMADLRRSDEGLSALHLLSGLIPLGLALSGNADQKLINMSAALNVVSLMYYAFDKKRDWAWYTAGAAVVAYFGAPHVGTLGPKVMYPLCLSLVEYCAFKLTRTATVSV